MLLDSVTWISNIWFLLLGNRSHNFNFIRYMNTKAVGNQAYVPTDLEHIANVVTHGLWVVPSLVGTIFLVQHTHTHHQFLAVLIYGLSLVALFTVSTFFHSIFYIGKFRMLKETLHMCDRAIIYIFIAASYTPWLLLKKMSTESATPSLGLQICWLVWLMAVLGIIYQYYFHEQYKHLETFFYVIIGVLPSVAIFQMQEDGGLTELAMGGAVYIVGVLFFKSDGRIPCAHAIWHLFVNIGATCHFYAVCKYLLDLSEAGGDELAKAADLVSQKILLSSGSVVLHAKMHEEIAL